ncbi:MAG: magnesium transporter [Mariniblastus sp.]|jgi:magnesium transporter
MSRRKHHRRRKPPRIQKRTAPGSIPGTLSAPADAVYSSTKVIKFNADQFEEKEIKSINEIRGLLDDQSVTWINVDGLGDPETFHQLSEIFGLHRLALEDALNVHQRAKVEAYQDHVFIVLRMVTLAEHLESEQVSMFLGKNYVLTIQERPGDCFDAVRQRLRESRGLIRQLDPDYLAYALIDSVIDGYFPVVDAYGERMEHLDEEITAGKSMNTMEVIHNLRSDLMALRRAIRPLRDALNQIKPGDRSFFAEETHYYLRDCYDHTIQIIDLLDSYQELCSNLRDYHMSIVSNRMNEVMKVLTITGTIFIPLTFIAGIYGMNFNTQLPGNMPELNWPYGYVFAWLLMLGTGLGLLSFVWKKGWLSSHDGPHGNGTSNLNHESVEKR